MKTPYVGKNLVNDLQFQVVEIIDHPEVCVRIVSLFRGCDKPSLDSHKAVLQEAFTQTTLFKDAIEQMFMRISTVTS